MAPSLTLPRVTRRPLFIAAALAAAMALVVLSQAIIAQVSGDRGIAPVAASQDINVGGIEVDVRGDTAEEAREEGWKQAQRKAWEKIDGPAISDGQLESLVSAVVVEREQIGPKRYIARLGVIFDRARAGGLLGAGGQASRSAPMLLLPVTMSAGTDMVYETRNPWQRAWAEYQPGASRIDYVRPSGAGGDSLLLTYGQTGRRSRTWWRNVLDQFGAADVIVPIARLRYRWPGGPVEGRFTARYGPDNTYLGSFTMTARDPDDLPRMLGEAVERFNGIYEQALADGRLRPDPTLNLGTVEADPAIQKLIELGRQIQRNEATERAAVRSEPRAVEETPDATPTPTATPIAAAVASFTVQFATPDPGAFDATLGAVRSAAGVRGAAVTSTAIGGTSVMSVTFGGSVDQLAAALRARGLNVRQAGSGLSVSR